VNKRIHRSIKAKKSSKQAYTDAEAIEESFVKWYLCTKVFFIDKWWENELVAHGPETACDAQSTDKLSSQN
jgi:hypothetical protein